MSGAWTLTTLGGLAASGRCGLWRPGRAVTLGSRKTERRRAAWAQWYSPSTMPTARPEIVPDVIHTDAGLLRRRDVREGPAVDGIRLHEIIYSCSRGTVLLVLPHVQNSLQAINDIPILMSYPTPQKPEGLLAEEIPLGFLESVKRLQRLT